MPGLLLGHARPRPGISPPHGAGLRTQWRRSVLSVAQVSGVNGAGPYRPLVANSLLLSHFMKILVPFCAEDY